MATVTVPSEFFRQELRVYTDWREAFARELLQNSVDAGATRIDINISVDEGLDGLSSRGVQVSFADNGCGMTRDTLDNVFFALGRTTKNDDTTIGGFGRARIILCFAQRSYQIRTGRMHVAGTGGEYTIVDVADHAEGCTFVIDLIDTDDTEIRYAFERVLSSCTVRPDIYLNGRLHLGRQMADRATRVFRDDNGQRWAKVYVQRDRSGALYVRVNGLTMFRRWLSGNDDVIIELDPRRSRTVMSAGRDQLVDPYRTVIEQFCDNLSKNRRAALREPAAPLDLHVSSGGFLRSDTAGERHDTADAPVDDDSTTAPTPTGGEYVPVTAANEGALLNMAAAPSMRDEDRRPYFPVVDLGFDVFLAADSNDTRVRRLVRTWNPAGWDHRTGARRRALLLAWKAAVQTALDTLVNLPHVAAQVTWTVGWTFTEGVGATHTNVGDNHVFSLNPVDADGRTRYRTSDKASRQRLLALAAHEVCHVFHSGHDEDFAGLLTEVHANLDMADGDRRIRDAVTNA